jgi:hypothetical protein
LILIKYMKTYSKYLLTGIAFFIFAWLFTSSFIGSPKYVVLSPFGFYVDGLFILPVIIVLLGFVRNLSLKTKLFRVCLALFSLNTIVAFVYVLKVLRFI